MPILDNRGDPHPEEIAFLRQNSQLGETSMSLFPCVTTTPLTFCRVSSSGKGCDYQTLVSAQVCSRPWWHSYYFKGPGYEVHAIHIIIDKNNGCRCLRRAGVSKGKSVEKFQNTTIRGNGDNMLHIQFNKPYMLRNDTTYQIDLECLPFWPFEECHFDHSMPRSLCQQIIDLVEDLDS